MSDRHKTKPKAVRMPGGLQAWYEQQAVTGGQPVNAVLVAALEEYRLRHSGSTPGVAPPADGGSTMPSGTTTSPSGDTTTEHAPLRPELKPPPQRQASCKHKRMTSRKGGKCHDCGDWVPASS